MCSRQCDEEPKSGNSFFKKIIKLFRKKNKEPSARDAIEELIEDDRSEESQSIAQNEREMIGNVLDLRDTQIQEVMIPRTSIVSIPVTASIEEVLEKFVDSQVSAILVYRGTLDNVIGMLRLKDVANWINMNKPFNASNFITDVLFVPPSMRTLDLIFRMKESGIKIAVVIDEYGGVDGLVSFIDLIEEIVGDIQDATDIKHSKKKVIRNSDGTVSVDGQSTFDEIKKYGNIEIKPDDDDNDTIGGMLSSILGRVPVRGELITLPKQNFEFEVLEADPRKVKTLKIKQIKSNDTNKQTISISDTKDGQ